MRLLYLLVLLSAPFSVHAAGDKVSDASVMETDSAVNTYGKEQQNVPVPEPADSLKSTTKQIAEENQTLIAKLQMDLVDQHIPQPEQQSEQKTNDRSSLSEDDKRVLNSPIFTPGGAPRPLPQEKRIEDSSMSAKENKKDNDKEKSDSEENTTTEDNSANTNSDTGTTSNLSNPNNNNYNNPSYPPSSSTGRITLKATFKPQNSKYQYTIARQAEADGINPFQDVNTNNLTLSINGTVYTKIAFCESNNYENCTDAKDLPWKITAAADTKVGYVLESIAVGNEKLNLRVPYISVKLTKKDKSTQNARFRFYNTSLSCTKNADNNLLCTIPTSGASFVIN